ncbi:glutaredoxin family protein [Rhodothermus marinus]|uniref:glutaredoxin family protein n=1 Tax=Rhodothermus marinus TaxID=29549 RepID=UPI0037C95580
MAKRQQCPLSFVWFTWLGLPGLALLFGLLRGWPVALLVLLVGIVGQIVYIRWFPRFSRWLGYGSVDDEPAETTGPWRGKVPTVRLYTASVCPFCPIVRRRLADLQQQIPFELEEVDVTFRPQLMRRKGWRSVPVVEVGEHYLVGNATSAQLAALLAEATRGPGPMTAPSA